jgi:opacity protein-like surface antigen
MTRFLLVTAGLFSVASATAFAADQEDMSNGSSGLNGVTGNVHIGLRTLIDSSGDDVVIVPEIRAGAKLALEPVESDFGIQIDGEFGTTPFSWVSPDVGADGSLNDYLGVGHLTYAYSENTKFGFYGGYEQLNIEVDGIDEDILDSLFTVDPGSVEASATIHMWQAGVEALFVFDPGSWAQVRAGIIDPYSISAEARAAGGTVTGSASDDDNDVLGIQLGAGYRTAFSNTWSMRGDINYTQFLISGSDDLSIWNVLATSQYSFETVPLAWTSSIGFQSVAAGGDSEDSFIGRSSLIYSFGEASHGSTRGKLFKAVNFLGDVN